LFLGLELPMLKHSLVNVARRVSLLPIGRLEHLG